MLDPQIVFEDTEFLIINKPYGVVVNRAETTKTETIQDWIENRYSVSGLSAGKADIQYPVSESGLEEFKSRSGIVHRLDKDTSGLLVIAKNPQPFLNLKNQFKDRSTFKKYLALVHGRVEPETGTINAPIERSPFNRMHFGVFPGGREAVTDYRVISNLKLQGGFATKISNFSMLELTPHTGRTHQIRVHMKYLNYPIVSDPIYGGRKNYQNDLLFCPRLFLHAAHLEINHPGTGERLIFDSPLPLDLQTALDELH